MKTHTSITVWKSLTLLMIAFAMTFFMSASYDASAATTYKRYVIADYLTIRAKASVSSKSLGEYTYGTKITCYGTSGNWTKVKKSGVTAYVYTSYLSKTKPSTQTSSTSTKSTSYTRYVKCDFLTIRKKPSASSKALGKYLYKAKVTCYGTTGSWTKVKKDGSTAYVFTSYLVKKKPTASQPSSDTSSSTTVTNGTGSDVAKYAKKFVGLKYVWGGESLKTGADCSGFTLAIYKHFGYSLPHSAKAQRSSGYAVKQSEREPGDLICYDYKGGYYHVGIYIGNNQVIHASGTKYGVKISTWNYRSVNCVRRIIK